ncbi:methylated-DNA--[protein]-cysteine S-methyltransferase [Blastopirellula retiformator]|uniref:methylated-DNA--[protein]-cysteine S-methyltransferase n=1 Tax=Blastopirellula retiformator TaxID=2527970 RepID=A0A5C5V7A7_9BACT|nr:MGMT family protein [Blastopirellula retiformator]TWT34448.1 Methylated-DNA--protein-cysteine methyltransferase [Blastopirellula retiformator]
MPTSTRRQAANSALTPTIFTIATDLGPLEIELRGDVVYRLSFAPGKRPRKSGAGLSAQQQKIVALLQQYAAGEPVDLTEIEIDLSGYPPFATRVYQQCRKIRPGTTLSYGELAAKAGSPNAARAVGSAMAKNRITLVIPCHRVVAAGGKLGGYSAPEGLPLKKRLLKLEQEATKTTST